MKLLLPLFVLSLLSVLAGCRQTQCFDAILAPPARPERFAFIAGDFTTSVLGVLDAQGEIINPPLISSGSVPAGALTALSGDVVLANSQPDERLLYVERLGADLITDVSRRTWFVEQQSRVSPIGSDGSTFSANPHDMLAVGNDRYWVTRHNPNTEPLNGQNRGSDIAVIARPSGQILDTIELDVANTTFEGQQIYARPDRMVFTPLEEGSEDGIVAVGLARLSLDFVVAGPGAIALVSTADQRVSVVELDPLRNCGEVRDVPDEPSQVLIVCKGSTFQSPEGRRTTSGVVLLDVLTRQVMEVWAAESDTSVLPPQHGAIALGGGHVAVVGLSEGDEATQIESQLIAIDMRTQVTRIVGSSVGDQLGFGSGTFDRLTRTLLVPDSNRTASNPLTIRRFESVGNLIFVEQPVVAGLGCDELTVREITLLSPQTEE